MDLPAPAEMDVTIDRDQTQLVEGQPLAAELQLDLVRLESMQGQ